MGNLRPSAGSSNSWALTAEFPLGYPGIVENRATRKTLTGVARPVASKRALIYGAEAGAICITVHAEHIYLSCRESRTQPLKLRDVVSRGNPARSTQFPTAGEALVIVLG